MVKEYIIINKLLMKFHSDSLLILFYNYYVILLIYFINASVFY